MSSYQVAQTILIRDRDEQRRTITVRFSEHHDPRPGGRYQVEDRNDTNNGLISYPGHTLKEALDGFRSEIKYNLSQGFRYAREDGS